MKRPGVVLALLLAACGGAPGETGRTGSRLPPGFEVRLDQVVYHRLDEQGLQIEASTDHVLLSPSSGQARFRRLTLAHRAGSASGGLVSLVAGGGSSNLLTGKLLLTDGVRVEDRLGRVLDVPSAAFDPDARALAGPGPATLTGPNYHLRADKGAVVDLETASVDLLGPVSGYIEPL
ncbi:MAG: hypothetical protein ABIJ09_13880 [Pseudomonadota bacterium]